LFDPWLASRFGTKHRFRREAGQRFGAPIGHRHRRRGAAYFLGKGRAGRTRRGFRHLRFGTWEGILALAEGIGKRSDARRFRARGAIWQLLPPRGGADDIRFDDNVARAADHEEMLDIVATDQDEAAAAIDSGRVDHRQARHASALRIGAQPVARESAHQPENDADQGEHHHERK
jgi:hypothetical protein